MYLYNIYSEKEKRWIGGEWAGDLRQTHAARVCSREKCAEGGGGGGMCVGEEKLLWFCSEQVGIPAMITLSVVAAESIIRAICAGLQARSSLPHRLWHRDARAAVETRGDKDEDSSEDAAQETRTAALYIYIYVQGGREEKGKFINYS